MEDEAYWNFTLDGFAEDVLANMKAASKSSGDKKGTYYGYSTGTSQMLIALSKYETELLNYVQKVNLLAPCTLWGAFALPPPTFPSL